MARPGWLRRGDLARARQQYEQAEQAYQVARQAADRAADRERDARQAQQHQAHQEANPDLRDRRRELLRVQAWRTRADVRAVEVLRPEWSRELGERPATVKGGRAWDRAIEQTIEYRQRRNVADTEHPLGAEPHSPDASLEQQQAWRRATRAVGRLRPGGRPERPGRAGDHREATGRGDHQGEHANVTGRRPGRAGDHRSDHEGGTGRGDQTKATSRSDRRGSHRDDHEATRWGDRGDHRATRMRPLDRERDHSHERAM